MKRFVLTLAVIAAVVATPSPVAAAATCTYNAAQHKVTVAISGAVNPHVYPIPGGYISVNGYTCGTTTLATLANTDTIVVTGDSQPQQFHISFLQGPFTPGFTNEAGTSDEVEWTVNLGGGNDTLVIVGNDNVNKYVFGQDNSQAGIPRKVNLNAGESTGVDGDVTLTNVENVTVWGKGGADSIRARGTVGTGPNAFSLPMLVYGGGGSDIIKGGEAQDRIYGEAGKDEVWGFGSGDFIHLDDGAPGDKGYGGAGNDAGYVDAGDSWQDN